MTKRLDCNQIVPNGARALSGAYGYVMQSGLPSELVDPIYLRVSQINNCAYCLDMHTHDLTKKGLKVEKRALVQAWEEDGGFFGADERRAPAWAESVTRVAQTKVQDSAHR
jgi:AhpD family alkylhydroperoxidase